MRSSHTATAIGSSLVLAAFAAAPAHADVTNAAYISNGVFDYRVVHMPDLDQRRNGLSNSGANHCVPTSTINLFCYAANHGYPFIEPGAANWQSNSNYSAATNAIHDMGVEMGTSGTSGTNGSGTNNGLTYWANHYGSGLISTFRKSKNNSYTPTVAKMAHLACQGWIVSFAYGRYDVVGSVNGIPVLSRDGGHAVTFNRGLRYSGEYILRYRDPNNDSSLSTQSTFEQKEVHPVAYTANFGGIDFRTMNAIAYPSSDGKVRLVDSYWGIRPTYAYSFANSSSLLGGGGGTIRLLDPTPMEGSVNLSLPSISISSFSTLVDLALHPDLTDGLVLVRSIFVGQPTLLRKLDLFTGEMTTLADAPEDLVELAPSREGFIYSFDALGKLFRLDSEGVIDLATSAVPLPTSVFFDDGTDTLRLLSISQRRIAKYSKTLGSIENFFISESIPLSGDGSVRVDPTTGKSWFKTDGSPLLYNIQVGAAGPTVSTITPPTIPGGVRTFQFGNNGELLLMGDGSVKVMKKTDPTTWVLDPTSPFNNLPGGSKLVLVRNSTNEDPAVHDSFAWRSLPSDQVLPIGVDRPDCDADLNGDDVVNGADLGLLLGAWGTVRGAADLNQDGTVNGADLGLLLGAWGNCL